MVKKRLDQLQVDEELANICGNATKAEKGDQTIILKVGSAWCLLLIHKRFQNDNDLLGCKSG